MRTIRIIAFHSVFYMCLIQPTTLISQLETDQKIVAGNLAGTGLRQVLVQPNGELIAGSVDQYPLFVAHWGEQIEVPNSTDIPYSTYIEWRDHGNNFDPLTGVFTVPKDGLYRFHVTTQVLRDETDFDHIPCITRIKELESGSIFDQYFHRVTLRSNYGEDYYFTSLVECVVGDEIQIAIRAITGVPGAAGEVKSRVKFAGFYIQ